MKVAIVQETIDIRRGGAETSTLEMGAQLARLGLDVTVLCLSTGDRPGDFPSEHQTKIEKLAVTTSGSGALRTMRFIEAAVREIATGRFDIVHAVTPCPNADVYQPRGGTYAETIRRSIKRPGGPLVQFLRSLGRRFNRRQQFLLSVEQELLGRPNPPVIAAVSDYVRRQIQRDYTHVPGDRIQVVFNGVDVEPLAPAERIRRRAALREKLRIKPDEPLVLFVAHNFKLKGLTELIRAARCSERPWKLAVVGRDQVSHYRRLARHEGVLSRIQFCGPLSDMPGMFAAADLLAHTTWYDPCSRVVLESICHGVPAVTTRFNGAAEIIIPDRNGAVIDRADDIPVLAAAIDSCLAPKLAAMTLSDAATARERLSMARHARELKALYERLVAQAAPGSPRIPAGPQSHLHS